MKKMFRLVIVAALVIVCAFTAFAQELKLSGEAKTGIYWKQSQDQGKEADTPLVRLHSMDDAGEEGHQGRFRLNMDYDNNNGFGMKTRIQWQQWKEDKPVWLYAFGYGNFFDNQMTVSVGKLGASPWGTGGPEMWKELEQTTNGGGARIEWKPSFVPGQLNVGFVLNYFDAGMDQGVDENKVTFFEILRESVVGVSYTHDYFHARFAYRFDSEMDKIQGTAQGITSGGGKNNIQDELVYRIEEHVLRDYLPGFEVWAMGYFLGISCQDPDVTLLRNWLFAGYEPPEMMGLQKPFTAQMRLGLDFIPNRQVMYLKPSFYWNFFDKLLSAGISFSYAQDFGNKVYEGSPFYEIELEPKVQMNFSSSYIAFVYNWRRTYFHEYLAAPGYEPINQTQRLNLRFCIYF